MTSVTHDIPCPAASFAEIANGRKLHDIRKDAVPPFRIGDRMNLREFDGPGGGFTGREQLVEITYITSFESPCALSSEALAPDSCILSLKLTEGTTAP